MRDSVGYGAFQKRLRLTLCFMSLRQLTFVAPSKCPHQPQLRLTAQFCWFRHFGGDCGECLRSEISKFQPTFLYQSLFQPILSARLRVRSAFIVSEFVVCFIFKASQNPELFHLNGAGKYLFLKQKFPSRFNWVKNFHSSQPRQKISPESPKWFYGFKKN